MADVTLEIIIGLLILAIVAVIVIVMSGVKIVQPYQQGVYMRLGSYVRILDQGLNFVTPLINQVVKIDLRTQVLEVPRQEVITKDNSPVNVDAVIYTKVIDPKKAFFQVTNHQAATLIHGTDHSKERHRRHGAGWREDGVSLILLYHWMLRYRPITW